MVEWILTTRKKAQFVERGYKGKRYENVNQT